MNGPTHMPSGSRNQSLPPAVVIGLDNMTGLQTARILAGHGVPVVALAKDLKHPCARTRLCAAIYEVDTSSAALISMLEDLGPRLGPRAVLYPCTDLSVLQISRHRQRLQDCYHVVLPEPDVVEMLVDKVRFYTYALTAGLPVPATCLLRSRADAESAAGRLPFPCLVKPPLKTPEWERHTSVKVFAVSCPEELLELYDRCAPWAELLIVQEWVAGADSELYSCNAYFNAHSEPVVAFVARKLRQWPPETGTSCLGEECRNDIVRQETVRLFQGVGYRGLAYLEMKRDARTGRQVIIEPNVGRPTGRSAIAEAGGVELLYTMYCDTVGLPLPSQLEQRYSGVKWIHLRRDAQSAFSYWRRGDLTLADWWRSWRGRKAHALFSWADPVPFWADLLAALGTLAVRRLNGRHKQAEQGQTARNGR